MVERGQWITPSFRGRQFLDKPIFYFWAQGLSLKLLGFSEAAVRLPGLMFGLFGAITTGLLAWRMFGRTIGDCPNFHGHCGAAVVDENGTVPLPARIETGRTVGLIAGILYATTILPTALAQAASHDVALIPWINLTLLLLWECDRASTWPAVVGCIVGAGFFCGLSILTKGLVGVAVVAMPTGATSSCTPLAPREGPKNRTRPHAEREEYIFSTCAQSSCGCSPA